MKNPLNSLNFSHLPTDKDGYKIFRDLDVDYSEIERLKVLKRDAEEELLNHSKTLMRYVSNLEKVEDRIRVIESRIEKFKDLNASFIRKQKEGKEN